MSVMGLKYHVILQYYILQLGCLSFSGNFLGDKLLLTQRKSHKENLTFEEEEKRLNTYCKKEKVPEPSRLNVALCCGEI